MTEYRIGPLTYPVRTADGRVVTCTVPADWPPALLVTDEWFWLAAEGHGSGTAGRRRSTGRTPARGCGSATARRSTPPSPAQLQRMKLTNSWECRSLRYPVLLSQTATATTSPL